MQCTPTGKLSTVACLNQTFLSKCVYSTQKEDLVVTAVSIEDVKKKHLFLLLRYENRSGYVPSSWSSMSQALSWSGQSKLRPVRKNQAEAGVVARAGRTFRDKDHLSRSDLLLLQSFRYKMRMTTLYVSLWIIGPASTCSLAYSFSSPFQALNRSGQAKLWQVREKA